MMIFVYLFTTNNPDGIALPLATQLI